MSYKPTSVISTRATQRIAVPDAPCTCTCILFPVKITERISPTRDVLYRSYIWNSPKYSVYQSGYFPIRRITGTEPEVNIFKTAPVTL
jgi:hypothetical protein